jgi:hypothetical protein
VKRTASGHISQRPSGEAPDSLLFDGYRCSFDAVWETALPWQPSKHDESPAAGQLAVRIDEHAGPSAATSPFPLWTKAII